MLSTVMKCFSHHGIDLARASTAADLLRHTRARRRWLKFRHGMLNQYEIGLALRGVLPHAWYRDLVGYSSLLTEPVKLVAEHFCSASAFRVVFDNNDDTFRSVSIDGGSIEITNCTDFANRTTDGSSSALSGSLCEQLKAVGGTLSQNIATAQDMESPDKRPRLGGSPVRAALGDAAQKVVERLEAYPSPTASPAIALNWRSKRHKTNAAAIAAGADVRTTWEDPPHIFNMSGVKKMMAMMV